MKRFLFIFALVVSLVLPGAGSVVYAMDYPSDLPVLPDYGLSKSFVIKVDGRYFAWIVVSDDATKLADVKFKATFDSDGDVSILIHTNAALTCYRYDTTSLTSNWCSSPSEFTLNPGSNTVSDSYGSVFVYSNTDIYDTNTGEVIFPLEDNTAEYPSNLPELPDINHGNSFYNIILRDSSGVYKLLSFQGNSLVLDKFKVYVYSENVLYFRPNQSCYSYQYTFNSTNDTDWVSSGSRGVHDSYSLGSFYCENYDFIWSEIDIYASDSSDEVVFPLPPGPLGIPEETLAKILTQENPLKEILKLLPMAIPCLIGYAALRKALRTLATILKTA